MVGLFGARGTGKTVAARQWLKKRAPPRLLVWDFKHDPTLADLGRPYADLPALIRAMAAPRWQLRYPVNHDADIRAQFDLLCRAAWLAGDLTLFVDEVPEVTKPGRAPPAWRKLVNVGRNYARADGAIVGVSILAAGIRAAECDVSFRANLDIVRAGRMAHEDDARALSKNIGCDWRELMTLPDLHYFERAASEAAYSRGIITFAK